MTRHAPRLLLALSLLATAAAGAWAAGSDWRVARTRDGIVAGIQERAGSALPVLRAEGVVEAGLYQVTAVLKDADAHDRWMPHTEASALLETVGELEIIVYHRTGAPWPVSDRDVVVRSKVTYYADHGELHNHFRNIDDPRKPPVEGVVRMPHLTGFHRLRALAPERTHVTYQIDADPGGSLPHWLVRLVSDNLAVDTLRALRERVEETRGRYQAQIARWTRKHGPVRPRPERAKLGTLQP